MTESEKLAQAIQTLAECLALSETAVRHKTSLDKSAMIELHRDAAGTIRKALAQIKGE